MECTSVAKQVETMKVGQAQRMTGKKNYSQYHT